MIKAERIHRWPRQPDFAHAARLSTRLISALENGRQPNPTPDTTAKVEDVLGWLPGSFDRIVHGGAPIRPDDPGLAEINIGWHWISDDYKAEMVALMRRARG